MASCKAYLGLFECATSCWVAGPIQHLRVYDFVVLLFFDCNAVAQEPSSYLLMSVRVAFSNFLGSRWNPMSAEQCLWLNATLSFVCCRQVPKRVTHRWPLSLLNILLRALWIASTSIGMAKYPLRNLWWVRTAPSLFVVCQCRLTSSQFMICLC